MRDIVLQPEHVLSQRVVDFNAVAAAAAVLFDVLHSLPSEVARTERLTWAVFLRFGIRGLAATTLLLNASQLGFARTYQFCRAYSFLVPVLIEVIILLAITLFALHSSSFCAIDSRTMCFAVFALFLALVIAQIVTFVLGMVYHPPSSAVAFPQTGCVQLSTPYDTKCVFLWPVLALLFMMIVNLIAQVFYSHTHLSVRRLAELRCKRVPEHVVVYVLLVMLTAFGASGRSTAARATVWWLVASLSYASSRLCPPGQQGENADHGFLCHRGDEPKPDITPEPSPPAFMQEFITVPLPSALRNLTPQNGRRFGSAAPPSISSLESIPSIATTIEFAPRDFLSPRNSRVDANYDAGGAYVPFTRRSQIPTEWRAPV